MDPVGVGPDVFLVVVLSLFPYMLLEQRQVGGVAPWGGEGPHGGVHAGSTVHVRVSD